MLIIGIDPGLRATGWGVISSNNNHISSVASGTIKPNAKNNLSVRLRYIFEQLSLVFDQQNPDSCAVEEIFVSHNAATTLKLGHARAIALLVPALHDLQIGEYAATLIKKTLSGSGRADKQQMRKMISILLPNAEPDSEHATDALAIAICHAQHATFNAIAAYTKTELV